MKKLLIGILTLGSISSFALNQNCIIILDEIYQRVGAHGYASCLATNAEALNLEKEIYTNLEKNYKASNELLKERFKENCLKD